MNKTEFIERISQRTGFAKSQTEIVIEAALQTIKEEDNVSLRGFATFVKKVYPARTYIIGDKACHSPMRIRTIFKPSKTWDGKPVE